jgi:uncharacterized SAM-binding protein YcdF (DUF218 family)
MIFKTFSILLILSAVIFVTKHKTKARILFGLNLLMLLAFSLSPVTNYLIKQIQPDLPNTEIHFSDKNIVVLLGGGSVYWPDQKSLSANSMSYSRIFKAFQIYQTCKRSEKSVCHILVSGGDPQLRGQSEFELIAKELQILGVANEEIVKEDRSRNTKENAFYSRELIRNNNYSNVVLVTSGYHIKRAENWFLHFKILSQIAPSDSIAGTSKLWPSTVNLFYSDIVIHELLGLMQIQTEKFINSI